MKLNLKRPELLEERCYINGKWLKSGKESIIVKNPATQRKIGEVPSLSVPEVKKAIDAAYTAFPEWSAKPAKARADLLRTWYNLLIEHTNDLAMIMTFEQGKPLTEAKSEINYSAGFIEWFSEEARRVRGDIIPTISSDRRILALRQPVGVVGAITPWNFPSAMIARKVAPALAAGCTVIIKPASQTPFSALALAKLAELAGIPTGVINIITGPSSMIGEELCRNPKVRKISFTGSTEVGKILIRQSADTVKKISMELGGNAPFIVFDDGNIDLAVKGALASKYRNAGQACTATNRIYVQEKIYNEFARKLAAEVKKLKTCEGWKEGAQIGPLIDSKAVEKVEMLLKDAVKKGAKIMLGGKRHSLGGTFFEPTLIVNATPSMKISDEEIFGPVSAIFKFKTEEEAIKLANNTRFGLAAYFYSENQARCWRVAEALEYGMVGVNESLISTPVAPFGGIKESGIGREGSHLGIAEYTEVKYVCLGHLG